MVIRIKNLHKQKQPPLAEDPQKERLFKVIGERIRNLRHTRGFTQRELGEKIGVNHSFISQIEAGAQVNLNVLKKISDALGKEVECFFWEDDRKKLFETLLAEKPIRGFLKTFLKLQTEDRTAVTKLADYLENKARDEE